MPTFGDYLTLSSNLIAQYGYAVIFFGSMIENIIGLGFLVPGLLILTIGGFVAADHQLNIFFVFVAAIVGTTIGDTFAYLVGRFLTDKLPHLQKYLSTPTAKRYQHLLLHKNPRLLLLFQYPVYSRMILPPLAGAIKFPFSRWLKFNLMASCLFCFGYVGIGYVLGLVTHSLSQAETTSKIVQYLIGFIFTIFLLYQLPITRKYLYKLAYNLYTLLNFFVRPHTKGAHMILIHKNEILLIKNTYGKNWWTIPGGGLKKAESFKQAAIRETAEEVGIEIKTTKLLYKFTSYRNFKHDSIEIYFSTTNSPAFNIDPFEIAQAAWFPLNKLPLPHFPELPEIIDKLPTLSTRVK